MVLSWLCWNIECQRLKVWGIQGTLVYVFEDVCMLPSQEKPTASLGHLPLLCHGIHIVCTVVGAWLMMRVLSAESRDRSGGVCISICYV